MRSASGELAFDEWHADPLESSEVLEVLDAVEAMIDDGMRELLVFHHQRDWSRGERIWTSDAEAVDHVVAKYASASAVEKEAFLGDYGITVRVFTNVLPFIRLFNVLNYAAPVASAASASDRKGLERFRLRFSGGLDLYRV